MITIISKNQPHQSYNLVNSKDYISCLPEEILTKIFESLGNLELSRTVCGVSKLFYTIANQDTLWSPWMMHLELPQEEIPQGKIRDRVIKQILKLNSFTKEAAPLLDTLVKTAHEIDAIAGPIMYKKMLSEREKEILKQLTEEANKKIDLAGKLEQGFYGHLFLRRLGLSQFTFMETYAGKLSSSYGSNRAWQSVAFEYINENRLEEAKKVFNFIGNDYSLLPILERLVIEFCRKDQLNQAILILADWHASLAPQELLRDSLTSMQENIAQILLDYAKAKNQFSICEDLIIKYISKKEQKYCLMDLVDQLLQNKLIAEAGKLIEKYVSEWEEDQDVWQSIRLIDMCIQTKKFSRAWSVAIKNNDKDDFVLDSLSQAFSKAGMFKEVEKVNEKLNLKKN